MKERDEFDYSLPLLKKEKDWPLIFAVIFGSLYWICYFALIGSFVITIWQIMK